MFEFFKKFKYETIAVRHFTINWTDEDGEITSNDDEITYIFKANSFDKRKVDIHTSRQVRNRGLHTNNEMYHNTVLPWLEHDPDLEKDEEEDPDPTPKYKKKGNLITLEDRRKDK